MIIQGSNSQTSNIGIIGGTFDPIHRGHLRVIQKLSDNFDKLLVIPSGQPWLRKHQPTASGADRFQMCVLAVAELSLGEKVEVLDIEVNRSGPTYSIETIEALKKNFPNAKITLILGADAASRISQWHRSAELRKLVSFLVVNRPGTTKSEFEQVEIDAFDISATQVRSAVSNGENLSNLITPSIWNFIKLRKLYGSK